MSTTDLKAALRASMEDDAPINGTDGSHETEAPKSADAIVQPDNVEIKLGEEVDTKELIAAAVQGEEVATSLDEVAAKADELVVEEKASEVSAEMLAMNVGHLLKPLDLDMAIASFESEGDVNQYHRDVAERCRLIAGNSRAVSAGLRKKAEAK